MKNKLFVSLFSLASAIALSSCDALFIFGKDSTYQEEDFNNCNNSLFFALYNYYGYEGQHFTNKWHGMRDALNRHGVKISGDDIGQKEASKFVVEYTSDCDLPQDRDIYMVNNQEWDSGVQFTTPFAKHKPMAVISTCNGVEFAASPILSSGLNISNATMGGFSKEYRDAFLNGSLKYVCAKYSAHVAAIVAAGVDAVDNGAAMRNKDGTALSLGIKYWNIQSLDQYDEMSDYDSCGNDDPTLRKINLDKFFDHSSPDYGAEKLTEFMAESTKDDVKKLYEENNGVLIPRVNFNNQINEVNVGGKLKLENYSILHNPDNLPLSFKSSDESILTIDNENQIIALKEGDANVTPKLGDYESQPIPIKVVSKTSQTLSTFSTTDKSTISNEHGLKNQDESNFRTYNKIKLGIISPSSINSQVGSYISYMQNYLARAYNLDVLPLGTITNQKTQTTVCNELINSGAELIISVQDDTERVSAIKAANDRGVYFGIVGSCQNPKDYAEVKDLPYYVGSVGTSVDEERKAADNMTEYYLQCMIKRNEGKEALKSYQDSVKGVSSKKDDSNP